MTEEKIEKLSAIIKKLDLSDQKIAFAESMTAGLVSSDFASVPGVSSVFLGGIASYSADVKKKVLGVNKGLIKQYSAESKEVTRAMAEGLKELLNPDISVAITGSAGNSITGYQISCSVGTTFICIIIKDQVHEFRETFNGGKRNEIRQQAADFIFDKLVELLNVKVLTEDEKDVEKLKDIVWQLESKGENERAKYLKEFIEKKLKKKK